MGLWGEGEGVGPLFEFIALFLISFIIVILFLEFFVYRKIKNISAQTEVEIRKLKEIETFRKEFLGDVSHELKTPIFAIQGFIETLLDGAMDDKKVNRKFLQKAFKHSERLSHLVQDILVITQIESGEIAMVIRNFDLNELVHDIVDSLETKFNKKGREITCKIKNHGSRKIMVAADEDRIRQVLYNLIDNAVKYGDPHGTITIELVEDDEHAIINVVDQGEGIAREHLARLFERFYRVDKSRSRVGGGTGLGLAICKHLIEAHNQKIWVRSTVGEGSVFSFSLAKAK
ncbi:MAG: sensor histidine kinase [Bacteroidia bacterium]|nr:sensor histidine kinase [Bacteroidia bacterium]